MIGKELTDGNGQVNSTGSAESIRAFAAFTKAHQFSQDIRDKTTFQRLPSNKGRYPDTPTEPHLKLISTVLGFAEVLPLKQEEWTTSVRQSDTIGILTHTTTAETPLEGEHGEQYGSLRIISSVETGINPRIHFGESNAIELPGTLEIALRCNAALLQQGVVEVDPQGEAVTVAYTDKGRGQEFEIRGAGIDLVIAENEEDKHVFALQR